MPKARTETKGHDDKSLLLKITIDQWRGLKKIAIDKDSTLKDVCSEMIDFYIKAAKRQ
jgi:hypothetical protein